MTASFSTDIEKDEASRRIVLLVTVILWILVFEGVLRKWLLPGASKVLLFTKEPLVLAVYYLAIRHKLYPRSSVLFQLGLVVCALFAALGALQCVGVHLPVAVAAYGWRQYCFLLPLPFVMAETFQGKDLLRLIRQSMIMATVNAVIVIMQSRSPRTSWINSSVGGDLSGVFGYGEEDIVRASGTFSFTYGHELFTASVVPMIITLWLLRPRQRGISKRQLWVYSAMVLINVLLDGNRGIFLYVAWALAACLPGFWLLRDPKLKRRALMLPVVAVLVGGCVYMTVFAGQFKAMSYRITNSSDTQTAEGTFDRLTAQFREAQILLSAGNILGQGLGLGSGGGAFMAAGSRAAIVTTEQEWSRVINETGVPGVLYMVYRSVLAVVLLRGAVATSGRTANLFPLLIASFACHILGFAQMAFNATCVYYGWLFAGYTMAANRLKERTD